MECQEEEKDDLLVFSDGSLASIAEDLGTPGIEHLILYPNRCQALRINKWKEPIICHHLASERTKRGHVTTVHQGHVGAYKVLKGA